MQRLWMDNAGYQRGRRFDDCWFVEVVLRLLIFSGEYAHYGDIEAAEDLVSPGSVDIELFSLNVRNTVLLSIIGNGTRSRRPSGRVEGYEGL